MHDIWLFMPSFNALRFSSLKMFLRLNIFSEQMFFVVLLLLIELHYLKDILSPLTNKLDWSTMELREITFLSLFKTKQYYVCMWHSVYAIEKNIYLCYFVYILCRNFEILQMIISLGSGGTLPSSLHSLKWHSTTWI